MQNREKRNFFRNTFDMIKNSAVKLRIIKHNHNLPLPKNYMSRLRRTDVDPFGRTTEGRLLLETFYVLVKSADVT